MELHLKLSYQQILAAIKELPLNDFRRLKKEVVSIDKDKTQSDKTLSELLLSGPTMSDEEYKAYNDNREKFSEWRIK